MLTAENVYQIAKELSNKELWTLYRKIGKDLYKEQPKLKGVHKNHRPITESEMIELLFTKIFKVKINPPD